MFLRLDMPALDKGSMDVELARWRVEPGQAINAGDVLADIRTRSQRVHEIPRNAKLLTKLSKSKVKTGERDLSMSVYWHVIAREAGTFSSAVAEPGTALRVGDPLALIAVGDTDDVPGDISDLAGFRSYAEKPGANEEGV